MTLMGVANHVDQSVSRTSEEVQISGFALWDRVLTIGEIGKVRETCEGFRKFSPVVIWDDFYESVKSNAEGSLISPTKCQT